ncbi:MAG: hypothetical protein AAF485_28170 [Chloroflexota bacterium]
MLPVLNEEYFETVTYGGKTISVGDEVIVPHLGKMQLVEVTSLVKKQDHYWVGYDANQKLVPWPLVKLKAKG